MRKKRIAIWGVEDAKGDPGQMVVRKFRKQGIEVIAVNRRFADDASQVRASSLTKRVRYFLNTVASLMMAPIFHHSNKLF